MSEDFLSRWARLKRSGGEAKAAAAATPATAPAASSGAAAPAEAKPAPLPSIESLEPGADIAQFMQAEVEESLKRQALKKLLQDPRFNVMDGLDVYIDDYSKPDPLPAGWLEKMNQTLRLGEYREPVPEDAGKAETKPPEDAAAIQPAAEEGAPTPDTVNEGSSSAQGTQSRRET